MNTVALWFIFYRELLLFSSFSKKRLGSCTKVVLVSLSAVGMCGTYCLPAQVIWSPVIDCSCIEHTMLEGDIGILANKSTRVAATPFYFKKFACCHVFVWESESNLGSMGEKWHLQILDQLACCLLSLIWAFLPLPASALTPNWEKANGVTKLTFLCVLSFSHFLPAVHSHAKSRNLYLKKVWILTKDTETGVPGSLWSVTRRIMILDSLKWHTLSHMTFGGHHHFFILLEKLRVIFCLFFKLNAVLGTGSSLC